VAMPVERVTRRLDHPIEPYGEPRPRASSTPPHLGSPHPCDARQGARGGLFNGPQGDRWNEKASLSAGLPCGPPIRGRARSPGATVRGRGDHEDRGPDHRYRPKRSRPRWGRRRPPAP
jgi:hypothetical protein